MLANITYKLYNNYNIGENIMDNKSYEFLSKILYPIEFNDNYILAYSHLIPILKTLLKKADIKLTLPKNISKA